MDAENLKTILILKYIFTTFYYCTYYVVEYIDVFSIVKIFNITYVPVPTRVAHLDGIK